MTECSPAPTLQSENSGVRLHECVHALLTSSQAVHVASNSESICSRVCRSHVTPNSGKPLIDCSKRLEISMLGCLVLIAKNLPFGGNIYLTHGAPFVFFRRSKAHPPETSLNFSPQPPTPSLLPFQATAYLLSVFSRFQFRQDKQHQDECVVTLLWLAAMRYRSKAFAGSFDTPTQVLN